MEKCPFCGGIKDINERIKLYQSILRSDNDKDRQIANLTTELTNWRQFEEEMEIIADNGIHTTFKVPTKIVDKVLGER